jgi:hypothetical protein
LSFANKPIAQITPSFGQADDKKNRHQGIKDFPDARR